ncbi:uncharacterized protein MELLADRAFT_90791 [Melampsora larici-populina 98AG31]|uniref:Uncharacterized protein n=1 Tax=Melampsora larici-populina (strain 98AG31 / pathotype 3-4-7) TaxID=747676 RepID=F4R7H9_MELLP|nr:uncharacterized protein MELLADRAFT_90791 [Melampsora larici-populina 98AG31]EGG11785.1 hypothetical protein MELLADRAFT_90791 [Melampsora larici-populina 98AG31]
MADIMEHQITLSINDQSAPIPPSSPKVLAPPPSSSSSSSPPTLPTLPPPDLSTPTNWNRPLQDLASIVPALLTHPSSIHSSPIINQPELSPELLRLPQSGPKKMSRAEKFFWWGFVLPLLWIPGTFHLHRRFCPKLKKSTREETKRKSKKLTGRLRARIGRNEVGIGQTSLVIIPKNSKLDHGEEEKRRGEEDWNVLSESPAERFLGESEMRLDWLVCDYQTTFLEAQKLREERKWACRCLMAIMIASGVMVIAVVINHHLQKGTGVQWKGNIPDAGNFGGASSSKTNRPL